MSPTRISLLAAVAAFLFCCILTPSFVRADGTDIPDPDTTVLTDDNFSSFIQNDLVLVEFYAPWCGHCKSLAPEYAAAATQLKASGVKLGKLDATVHSKTAGAYSISGYPTLKVFRNGKAQDYSGPRKTDGIVSYMKKQVGPAAKPVTSAKEVSTLIDENPAVGYVILGVFNEEKPSQLQSAFNLIANKMRDEFVFARSSSEELRKEYGIASGQEALVAFLYGDKFIYTGSSKTSEVEQFIRDHSLPLVGEYNDVTQPIYSARKLPVATLFINVDKSSTPSKPSKTMLYYINRLKKLATEYKDRVLIAYADRTGQKGLLEHMNLQNEEHGFVVSDLQGNKQYRYEEDEDEDAAAAKKKPSKTLPLAGWTKFLASYLSGSLSPYVKSERAPKDNLSRPVKIATGANFQSLITDANQEKDVLIEFYAPWCGHCKALEPKYNELGKKLQAKGQDDIILAKLDATANDFDRSTYAVSGYPTIYFKAAGSGSKPPVKYEGAREVKDMYDYLKKNAKKWKKAGKKEL